MRKKKEEASPGSPLWMVSYGDMMGLLLTFFIMIASYSSITDSEKFGLVSRSVAESFGVLSYSSGNKAIIPPIIDPDLLYKEEKEKMLEFTRQLKEYIKSQNYHNNVNIISNKKGITIRIKSNFLFEDESDQIKSASYSFLNKILSDGEEILKIVNVYIESHTSNQPISGGKFRSNIELSISRSARIVEYLLSQNKSTNMQFGAMGSGSSKPLFPNNTSFQRSLNNRLEINFVYKSNDN